MTDPDRTSPVGRASEPSAVGPATPAAARTGARPVAPPTPRTDDWPIQATDQIVKLVDTVRDKTTGPALTAAAAVKYGILALLLALPLTVLVFIALFRGLERALIGLGLHEPMWIVDLVFGSIFLLTGMFLWRKSTQPLPAAKELP
jgi:hypothetical protein